MANTIIRGVEIPDRPYAEKDLALANEELMQRLSQKMETAEFIKKIRRLKDLLFLWGPIDMIIEIIEDVGFSREQLHGFHDEEKRVILRYGLPAFIAKELRKEIDLSDIEAWAVALNFPWTSLLDG